MADLPTGGEQKRLAQSMGGLFAALA